MASSAARRTMRGKAMTRDRSEEPRSEEIAEEWCCAIPAISKSSREDVARHGTDRARVGEVWDRYREQVMHLPGVVEFRRTRLAIWAEPPLKSGPTHHSRAEITHCMSAYWITDTNQAGRCSWKVYRWSSGSPANRGASIGERAGGISCAIHSAHHLFDAIQRSPQAL